MDTPEKAQIGSPMSNFEESPFSNFINSLSPIKPSKAIRVSHTFGSLSFASPPSVFTSPQINLQRESRFLRRDQLPELAKPESSSDNENKDVTHKDACKADNWPSDSANEVKDAVPSNHEGSVDASSEASNLALMLPRELKYDCGSSTFQTAPSFGCEMILKSAPGTSSRVPLFHESSTTDSFGTQLSSIETDQSVDVPECVWDNLIYDASDLLVFESPQGQGALKDHPEKPADEQTDFFASLLSHFPEDDVNDLEQLHGLGPLNSDVLLQRKDQLTQLAQANKLKQIYQGQDNDGSSSLSGIFTGSGQTLKKLENKPIMHRGIRRRCLVFEIPGARKNVADGSISTTSSSQDEANALSNSKQPAVRQGGDSPMCIRPGIGLHLNALAVGHRVLKSENPSMPGSSEFFPSPETSSDNFQSSALISSQELGNVENEVQGAENASQASAYGFNEDLNPSSPKKKRRRSENSGEGEACKRCNCKKSKCLKLYCECFAAGVYCVEPCACQDCFNKPIHEDTVLATRKQIESRNPLAFAPKVIKGSESVIDLGDDSNRTPASARHKRGCNCKKSNCLKKYCECYQGGVGCSIGCRCEGCKNTFGRKDGIGMELEVEEDTPAHEDSMADRTLVQPGIHNDEESHPLPVLPKTPLRLFRSPMPLPSASNGKPPRFGGISSCSLLNRDGTGRSTFLRSQHKTDMLLQNAASGDDLPAVLQNTSPSSSIKTLSPNSKRITPPNHDSLGQSPGLRSSRKLILQSIPSFPSLTPRR